MKKQYALPIILTIFMFYFALCTTGGTKNTKALQNEASIVAGYISENTTWTLSASPYIVEEDVVVEPNVFLTVEPGVIVKFVGWTNLIVDGGMVAQGNSTHEIVFTSNATSPEAGDWGSIRFRDTSIDEASVVEYALVEYSTDGISLESASPKLQHANFAHNIIGIRVKGNNVYVEYAQIEWNFQGVYVDGNNVTFSKSKIWNNTHGIYSERMSFDTHITVLNSTLLNNTYGVSSWNDGSSRQSYINLTHCTLSFNNFGVYGGESLSVTDSFISNNSDCAVLSRKISLYRSNVVNNGNGISTSSGETTIYDSMILNNNGTGVFAPYGFVIWNSSLIDNQIGVNGTCIPPFSKGEIHYGNIYSNSMYGITNLGTVSQPINATYNWWGSTNETLIDEQIHDYYDDYNLGQVFYNPYLTEPGFPSVPWDITGPVLWVPDGKCDIRDVAIVALRFGSEDGDEAYDSRADITGPTYLVNDGKIDIRDIALVAIHFGEVYF